MGARSADQGLRERKRFDRYVASISASEQILKAKTFGLACQMPKKFLESLKTFCKRFSRKNKTLNYNLYHHSIKKGAENQPLLIFYSFVLAGWHAPLIGQAPQEPPQEQMLLPFFFFITRVAITAPKASAITEIIMIDGIRSISLSAAREEPPFL